MELDNFTLYKYNPTSIEHKTVIIELENDANGASYLGNLEYAMLMQKKRKEENKINDSYIAYYNDEPIGYIAITTKTENTPIMYEISYGIRPSYRKQYLASMLLQEFSEKLFELYPEIEELTLIINNLNTGSKKVADLAGFSKNGSVTYKQGRVK